MNLPIPQTNIQRLRRNPLTISAVRAIQAENFLQNQPRDLNSSYRLFLMRRISSTRKAKYRASDGISSIASWSAVVGSVVLQMTLRKTRRARSQHGSPCQSFPQSLAVSSNIAL